jgi:hypothetical protein
MRDLHKQLRLLLMSPQKFEQGSAEEHVLTPIIKVRIGHIVCFGEFAQVNPFWINHAQNNNIIVILLITIRSFGTTASVTVLPIT